jgi:leader peptidase (prepilin peptidase) / N-methyltransferase
MLFSDILLFPNSATIFLTFCYGIIIGSFLNVVIYRFHTGKSLRGRSHCLSCATPLRSLELIPLFSYLGLAGRCRSCGSYIPVRYFLVEVMTGILFVLSFFAAQSLLELLYIWIVLSILVVIVVYDIRHYIIPDGLTIALLGLVLAWSLLQWQQGYTPTTSIIFTLVEAVAASGFLFSLWFISKGRWIGFGDVKLVFPLALLVGTGQVFSMVVLSFWIGAVISVALVSVAKLQRGKLSLRFLPSNLTIKSVVPFAPFLIAGCLVVLFTHFNVLSIFTY